MSKTAIERVIETAKGEIGYLEKETNSRLDNKTANAGDENWNKYARDLDALGVVYNGRKNGYSWCDIFVDWCFIHTFGLDAAMEMLNQDYKGLGAGCTYSANYFKNAGRFHESPQPGDQIFFTKDRGKTSYHTGLVVDVRGGRVYTVEGNTSSLPGVVENGGCVRNKDYPKTITVDNGSEFSDRWGMERSWRTHWKQRTRVFYCHPYSSWERGSNEKQNQMIRWHFPKGTNFTKISQARIDDAVEWLNNYPRKILGWRSAGEAFQEFLASVI